jgi:hypothetical protein
VRDKVPTACHGASEAQADGVYGRSMRIMKRRRLRNKEVVKRGIRSKEENMLV